MAEWESTLNGIAWKNQVSWFWKLPQIQDFRSIMCWFVGRADVDHADRGLRMLPVQLDRRPSCSKVLLQNHDQSYKCRGYVNLFQLLGNEDSYV